MRDKQTAGDVGRSSLIQLDFLLQTIPGIVIVYKIRPDAFEVLTCTRGIKALTGWDAEEFCRRIATEPEFKKVYPADEGSFRSVIGKIVATQGAGEIIYRGYKKDGSIIWLWLQGHYAGQEDGCPLVEALILDVSNNTNMYQTILDESQSIVTVVDANTFEALYANKAAEAMVAAKPGSFIGSVCHQYVYGKDKPCDSCIIHHTQGDSFVNEELEVKGRFYRQVFKRLQWQGRDAIMEFTTDITEQIQNRRLVEKQREMQQHILDTIPAGIMVFKFMGDDIQIVSVNRSILDMMGMDKNKALGEAAHNITALTHPEDLPIVLDAAKRLSVEGAYVEYEYRHFFRTRNDYIWVLGQGRSIRDADGYVYAYVNYTDITARKQVEALQNRQRELFDTIPSGILEFFFDGRTVKALSANQTLIDMIGYDAADFFAQELWNLGDVVHPDDYHLLQEACQSIPLGKGMTYDFRLLNKKTGRYRWISCDYTITERTPAGVKVISAFLDIDDKRKAEDASAAKSRFLSRMSHEIRTPINAIMGIAELERQDIESKRIDLESLARYSKQTFAASNYLLTLVNDILDTSRIENNQIQIQQHPVRVTQYLADVQTLVEPLAKEKNIHFSFERKTRMHEVYIGDGVRVKQIIVNLLNNAFKFTPPGGAVSLVCQAVGETAEQTTLQFTVADNGIGMSKEFQEKLFTPFVQENSDTTSPFAGSGLGLSIARNLAQKMGGDIVCQSEKGKGTTFVATIVVKNAPDETPEAEPSGGPQIQTLPAAFAGVRILVCEDHPLNQKITKALLERKKCQVELACDGAAGLDMFAKSPENYYSMILMDIRMPVMDGLEATKAIRSLKRADARTVPVVAMSANAYDEDVQKSLAAGMNGHLAKPVDAAKLYQAIASFTQQQ